MFTILVIAAVAFGYLALAGVIGQLTRQARADRREHVAERGHWRTEREQLLAGQREHVGELLAHAVRVSTQLPEELRRLELVHVEQLGELADAFAAEREAWRNQQRELLNRIQHPTIMPTGTRPTPPPAAPDSSVSERARRAWLGVGAVGRPPVEHDAQLGNELGSEVP